MCESAFPNGIIFSGKLSVGVQQVGLISKHRNENKDLSQLFKIVDSIEWIDQMQNSLSVVWCLRDSNAGR